MKAKVSAKDLMSAVKTVGAVHGFGQADEDVQAGLITLEGDVLSITAARMGACCTKRCPAQTLRPGTVGVNVKDLERMKLAGTVVIDATKDKIKISDSRSTYSWNVFGEATASIEEHRGTVGKIKPMAKIPTTAFQSGVKFATYKSEIKDGYVAQVTIKNGYFEFAGLDPVGGGRFCMAAESIQAKEKFHFILGDVLLSKIIPEVDDAIVVIGVSKDGSVVSFSSKSFECQHPAVDREYVAMDDVISDLTKDPKHRDCVFSVMQADLKQAIETIKPVGSGKDIQAKMVLWADKSKGVALRHTAQAGAAMSKVEVENLKAKGTVQLVLRASYFEEFVKAAPKTVALQVESWQKQYIRILVEEEQTKIEYIAMMIEQEEQSAE